MGLEPTRYCYHRHLKPARLPIPPLLHFYICCVLLSTKYILHDKEEIVNKKLDFFWKIFPLREEDFYTTKKVSDSFESETFLQCRRWDLNPHDIATTGTWSLRVCQFRHSCILNALCIPQAQNICYLIYIKLSREKSKKRKSFECMWIYINFECSGSGKGIYKKGFWKKGWKKRALMIYFLQFGEI